MIILSPPSPPPFITTTAGYINFQPLNNEGVHEVNSPHKINQKQYNVKT
jgi:hypothetical protein